jgi:prevent-host-death family protein
MLKITDQQFKKRFSYILNKVSDKAPVIITRKHNPSLVILSLEDFKEITKILSNMQNYYDLVLDMQEIQNNNETCK